MINRALTHKKVELSNRTYAKLLAYKNKTLLAKMQLDDYTNLSFDDIINKLLIMQEVTEEVNTNVNNK